ncbi:DUF2691 family protein [Lysinibacillus sp. NPDC096418]|uniref:DUF2691 family protein n=1 Tax=Lysinibacillus sp. NPDC096418 TaxID=3364138 RepID=UPI0037F51C30
MYRGIGCSIPNEHGQSLGNILAPVDLARYMWKVGNSDAYFVEQNNFTESFFSDDEYERGITGADLQMRLRKDSYYTIFMDLKGYPSEQFTVITTYEDFLKSDCEIVILLSDCTYFNIYCKNPLLIEKMYRHAKAQQFEDLQYLTEENDGRTRWGIW